MGGQPQDADRSRNAELLAMRREVQMRWAAEHWIEREVKARQERDEARETLRRIGQIVDGAIRCADQAGHLQCLSEVDAMVRKTQPPSASARIHHHSKHAEALEEAAYAVYAEACRQGRTSPALEHLSALLQDWHREALDDMDAEEPPILSSEDQRVADWLGKRIFGDDYPARPVQP